MLTSDFFAQDTLTVARALLGCYLVRERPEGRRVCRITETEAYIGRIDKACHAYGYKRTKRSETLFMPPGTIYNYLIYGMYYCLNLVTEAEGEPCAVLLRGAEAVLGEEDMARARFGKGLAECSANQRKNFLNGPGKLCRALALTREENAKALSPSLLWVTNDPAEFGLPMLTTAPAREVQISKRIGIDYAEEATDFPWRFVLLPASLTE